MHCKTTRPKRKMSRSVAVGKNHYIQLVHRRLVRIATVEIFIVLGMEHQIICWVRALIVTLSIIMNFTVSQQKMTIPKSFRLRTLCLIIPFYTIVFARNYIIHRLVVQPLVHTQLFLITWESHAEIFILRSL